MEASRDFKEVQCWDRSLTFRVFRGHGSRSIAQTWKHWIAFLDRTGAGVSVSPVGSVELRFTQAAWSFHFTSRKAFIYWVLTILEVPENGDLQ